MSENNNLTAVTLVQWRAPDATRDTNHETFQAAMMEQTPDEDEPELYKYG